MNFKDIGKGLRKLGKSKIAKEITEEVTDESLESITKGLLEKNKELLNSVGNQWKKEPIDTAGALSHLPEIKPMPKGVLRNKGESVLSKSPLRVIERTGKYRSGYDVVGMSADFDIEGVIKSKNARNYLIGSLDVGPFETRYLLGGKAKKTPENKLLGDRVSFNANAQNYIDNGVEAPYWVRKRAERTNVKAKKEIPVNNSTQQEQQLLLDAPKQKEPRKPRRKYKSDLGTNTEPIELSGPTKNRRLGNRAAKKPTQQEQKLLLEAPKQKSPRKPRREYKSDLGVNTEPIELSGPTKNRRRGNRSVKETPVNTSVQQSQQLLLDAPKQKSPRREYKPDLGTNTEPIPLSGPVNKEKKTLNFKKGEGTYTNPNKKRISESSKYNTKLIKKYHPTDPTYNLGIKTEGGWIGKEKDYRLPKSNVQPEPPVEPAPQSKPEPKNNKIDVSIDDFKSADELEQMNIDNDNEIDVTHLLNEEEPKKVKSRAEEYSDKLEELETKYSNGDISDIEYAKEQQRLQDIFEKENPVDVSNVLSDQKEPPFNIDDFSMPNIDEVDIEKKLWKDAEKEKLPKEPSYKKSDTYDLNVKRESRTYLTESEYFDQVDRIEEMYNNGELTDQEYVDELNRAKKDYVPELVDQANEETKQYIKDNLEQEPFDPELEHLYINPKDRKNIINKRNQGDYNANVTNGFVDDITVDDETYNFKYRNGEKTVVDIYDSNNNLVTDKDLYDDILSKGKQERDNFYRNLSDEEWDTVINNAEDFRFDKQKDALESNRKLRNQNDAIKMKQEVLKEKSDKYQTEYENEKSKKKRKEIEKKRNNSEIDILQAEKLKKKNDLKLEARNERQVAREAFQKKVKEEGLEKGTEAYNEALKELKESFKNSEKTMEKRIASSNKALDAQIKGWSGKGLTLKNAVTIGFSAKAAVDKYKEARAEGKSAGSAAIRAGASAVAAEVLGPLGSTALMAAQVAPKAIVAGADALYKEHRRMNSASNFVPLGGVNFQDSQELATMRQSGMELAKMSQYNLEQSLMGAEAKHLHR